MDAASRRARSIGRNHREQHGFLSSALNAAVRAGRAAAGDLQQRETPDGPSHTWTGLGRTSALGAHGVAQSRVALRPCGPARGRNDGAHRLSDRPPAFAGGTHGLDVRIQFYNNAL